MKIKDFGVEQWMNEYETKAKYNLGETCVSSLSIREASVNCVNWWVWTLMTLLSSWLIGA